MERRVAVRVHYPLDGGRIALRMDADWDRDLSPARSDRTGRKFDFELPVEGTHVYFKPVLQRGGETTWAKGEDQLALADMDGTLDVFPHFFAEPKCSICGTHEVPSKDGSRTHTLRVFLPPGYDENLLERYPVLYMQDGQNLFFPDEAFNGHHWKVQESLGVLESMNLVRKVIVVGIYPNDRTKDYTADGYAEYGRYLVEDVKPWVDAKYRTLTGAADTAVLGSSLGGVVSFHLAWEHPDVFGNAGCLSSTFGWNDDLLDRVRREPRRNVRFYLDSGWPRDNYEATRTMRNALLRRGWTPGRDLQYVAFPNARHNEEAWSMRIHVPFQFFFGK